MKYRTQQERRSAKTVPDRLPGSLGHFSVPYQRLKLPVGFSDVNSVRSLLIAFGSRAFSLTTNLLKNQEHIGQPKFPCVEQNHACSVNLMRLRDGSHSSAQNEVPGVYGIGTDYGQSLSRFNLAYETWGILSSAKDNVILLHIALSASSNAKSHDLNKSFGWWEKFIGHGPNYPIDLNWYFVICTNVLGSCYGSTGPSSINPETNEPMGPISQSSQSLTRSELSSSCWIILHGRHAEHSYCLVGASKGSKCAKHQWLLEEQEEPLNPFLLQPSTSSKETFKPGEPQPRTSVITLSPTGQSLISCHGQQNQSQTSSNSNLSMTVTMFRTNALDSMQEDL
ncbi:hypothetical protein PPACK8108_LOCUS756 [Phakopsora pachyrhizi]|uniref:Uncharacterized protein n=1 Tax=Phakopsora pachyrhizi TaxID=170000 RepID=A0AAV0AGN1_PHAPC|nr:hypothetical protein PPACK8108_LOCUS756 [Phakopsora pachyrhizi]